jgi:hypothetical protein
MRPATVAAQRLVTRRGHVPHRRNDCQRPAREFTKSVETRTNCSRGSSRGSTEDSSACPAAAGIRNCAVSHYSITSICSAPSFRGSAPLLTAGLASAGTRHRLSLVDVLQRIANAARREQEAAKAHVAARAETLAAVRDALAAGYLPLTIARRFLSACGCAVSLASLVRVRAQLDKRVRRARGHVSRKLDVRRLAADCRTSDHDTS